MRRQKRKGSFFVNRLFGASSIVFCTVLFCFSVVLSFSVYHTEQSALLKDSEDAMRDVFSVFERKYEAFWSLYIPIIDYPEYASLVQAFYADPTLAGRPLDVNRLVGPLRSVAYQDADIAWVLIYAQHGETDIGYVYYPSTRTLRPMDHRFAFADQVRAKVRPRELMGTRTMYLTTQESPELAMTTFGIAGGPLTIAGAEWPGAFAVGYQSNALDGVYRSYNLELPTRILLTTLDGEVLYDSAPEQYMDVSVLTEAQGSRMRLDSAQYYTQHIRRDGRNYMISYLVPWRELFLRAHQQTPIILGIVLLFIIALIIANNITRLMMKRRMHTITEGLSHIGQNHLEYRIAVGARGDEFDIISDSINRMAERMDENIRTLYLYELQKKNAEMSEMQAKFNPHFLYNTMELLRIRLSRKGDKENAGMVVLMSRIFRRFINSRQYVTIAEELAFLNMYFELFRMQYEDTMTIRMEVAEDVLACGIIRNLLQPMAENYFVHGFDAMSAQSCLIIRGNAVADDGIEIIISDNGMGMAPQRLAEIQHMLGEAVSDRPEASYGLRNVNDRIRLFYGEGYGLRVVMNHTGGIDACVRIRRMSVEAHEAWGKP